MAQAGGADPGHARPGPVEHIPGGDRGLHQEGGLTLAKRHEVDEWLLEAPGADLDIVIIGAQLRRLNTIMAGYSKFTRIEYEDQTREWTDFIRQYDATLEVACGMLNVPLPMLPGGVVRRFRPEAQLHIEKLILEAGYDVSARPGWDPLVDSQTPNLDQVVEGEIAKQATIDWRSGRSKPQSCHAAAQ